MLLPVYDEGLRVAREVSHTAACPHAGQGHSGHLTIFSSEIASFAHSYLELPREVAGVFIRHAQVNARLSYI